MVDDVLLNKAATIERCVASARDVFELLARASWISSELAQSLKHMVGFRNIAVHDYQTRQLPITVAVLTRHLDDFLQFSQAVLKRDARPQD